MNKGLAENEEKINYEGRMVDSWVIIVIKRAYGFDENEEKLNNYYVNESFRVASEFLITAIHNAGLVTLIHASSPMNFLIESVNRHTN